MIKKVYKGYREVNKLDKPIDFGEDNMSKWKSITTSTGKNYVCSALSGINHYKRSAMKILLVTRGSQGDIYPYLTIASALIKRGHQVTLNLPQIFEKKQSISAGLCLTGF